MGDKLLTKTQAAARLGACERSMDNYVRLHGLPVRRSGRRTFFAERDIAAWLDDQRRMQSLVYKRLPAA